MGLSPKGTVLRSVWLHKDRLSYLVCRVSYWGAGVGYTLKAWQVPDTSAPCLAGFSRGKASLQGHWSESPYRWLISQWQK